jgi:hypothetical protein
MEPTEQETEMLETMRSWSEHPEIKFTASFENGVWECEEIATPHPSYLRFHNDCPPDAVFVLLGVGTTFVEAFNNLAGNNDEAIPAEDGGTAI